jgi:hypothetical protein
MARISVGTELARALVVLAGVVLVAGTDQCQAEQAVQALPEDVAAEAARLIAAYPDLLDSIEGNTLVWKDGTRMEFDDGKAKDFEGRLNGADIEDQFALDYPLGPPVAKPAENFDPGRFRNEAFFNKMYGDCDKGEVSPRLVHIDWLPKHGGGKLAVTKVNGVAEKLKAVSDELEKLLETRPELKAFLIPPAGVYNCRKIAGSALKSVHAYGAAVDINTGRSDYWRWREVNEKRAITYRNRIPYEIVEVFERHGFIWGGRWYHFDTMHFEYRPELLPREAQPPATPTTPASK